MTELCAWFVLFPARSPHTFWWQRVLRPGYRHCLAMREDGEGRTLIIEHAGAKMIVMTMPLPIGDMVREMQKQTTAMALIVELPQAQGQRPPLRPSMTCVETVKAALGLHHFWIITPAALARHLRRRHGAIAVLPATS